MSISQKDIKVLWSKAAGRCSICDKKLITDSENTVIGEMAHIIAKSSKGPRGNIGRNYIQGYDNLILLCKEHHTLVDKESEKYTIKVLLDFKEKHENKISKRLEKNVWDDDISFIETYLSYVPFLNFNYLISNLPNSINLDFFEFIDIFNSCCLDNPHLYPLRDDELQAVFEDFIKDIYQIKSILEGTTNNKNIFINSERGDYGDIILNQALKCEDRERIILDIEKYSESLSCSYKKLINFLRNNYPEIDLKISGSKRIVG